MGKILAIEAATKICSIAVMDDGILLGETSLFVPQVHAERLVVMIDDILKNLKFTYHDLDAVAFSSGPGSFTGLRIGLSVAKGIAFGQNKNLIAVPTLEAVARTARHFADHDTTIVPILHARANEFYYSSFMLEQLEMRLLTETRVAEAETIAAGFPHETLFVGEGVVEFSKLVLHKAEGFERVKRESFRLENVPASAKEVAAIAFTKFKLGEFVNLRTSVPMYIKDFIAIRGNPLSKLLEKI